MQNIMEEKKDLLMAQTTQDVSYGPVFIVVTFHGCGWCCYGCCCCHIFDVIVAILLVIGPRCLDVACGY